MLVVDEFLELIDLNIFLAFCFSTSGFDKFSVNIE